MSKKNTMLGLVAVTVTSGLFQTNANALETQINKDVDGEQKIVHVKEDKVFTVTDNLNLRESPDKYSDNIILTMKKGSNVRLLEDKGDWMKIEYSGMTGYASREFLSEIESESEVVKQVKVVVASSNVRVGASSKHKIIGSVKRNAVLDVYGFNNAWVKIKYKDKIGYVSSKEVEDIIDTSNEINKSMTIQGVKSLKVRTGPGSNYSIKGTLREGDTVIVKSIDGEWARIEYKGADAYIESKFLHDNSSNVNPDIPVETPDNSESNGDSAPENSLPVEDVVENVGTMYVKVSKTLVRSGAGNGYSILGTIEMSDAIEVVKHLDNGWSEVIYKGKVGYVETNDLSKEPQASTSVSNVDFESYKEEVLRLVNIERAKEGLVELTMDYNLSRVAQLKSEDMIKNNYFSHNSPVYGTPFDMMKSHGIRYRIAGENIAMGHSTPQEVVQGWMNSEGHRKNIMNPRFTHLGMGIQKSESGRIYWTQMFTGQQ